MGALVSLPRPVLLRIAAGWLIVAVATTIIWHLLEAPQAGDFKRIAADPGFATATVAASDPGDHDSFLYRFRVGGTRYSGGAYPQATDQPEAASLTVGAPVSVQYDRADPGISGACDPQASINGSYWSQNAAVGVLVATFYAAGFTVITVRRRRAAAFTGQ